MQKTRCWTLRRGQGAEAGLGTQRAEDRVWRRGRGRDLAEERVDRTGWIGQDGEDIGGRMRRTGGTGHGMKDKGLEDRMGRTVREG